MTYLDTKTLYAMFLDSDWWRALSRRKRNQAGKCERCPARDNLQAHHKLYRPNWFDTLIEDLEALCRKCHEREHGVNLPLPKKPAQSISIPDWLVPKPEEMELRKVLADLYNKTPSAIESLMEEVAVWRPKYSNLAELNSARSHGLVSREEFIRTRDFLKLDSGRAVTKWMSGRVKKANAARKRLADMRKNPPRRRGLNIYNGRKWVNRGSSSN